MPMNDPLFAPIAIKGLEIRNRIYLPAMHLNMARDGQVTDQIIDFYTARAKGGAGAISVGFATVHPWGGGPSNIGIYDDVFLPGLTRLAGAINAHGACSVIQINHAGRYNPSANMGGQPPVAPSPIASRLTKETPRELSLAEIEQLIEDFALAAWRGKQAGYQMVEVLCGTGYLISEFLSPLTNQRTDAYGGDLENRMRFGYEIVRTIKARLGADYPLIVRMNGNDFMPGGQGRRELQIFAQAVVKAGTDALSVNVGWHEARVPQIVTSVPRGTFAYLARGIKELTQVPVIASHRINDPSTARTLIADGMCDMVAMGRPLIADPDLPEKAHTGREKEIIHCIACAQGCFDHLFQRKSIECLCNPRAGREGQGEISKAAAAKHVLVVGGGPAGMSAALAAAQRGHRVTLVEKENRLGGQLYLASAPPGRAEFKALAMDLAAQIELHAIQVKYDTTADEAFLTDQNPDHVILATGAEPLRPALTGAGLPHVVQAWDVLADRVYTGQKVVIIGGGAVGVETALFLAEKGTISGDVLKFLLVNKAEDCEVLYELACRGTKNITLVEMIDHIGKDIGITTRWGMLQELHRLGVKTLGSTEALEITADSVQVRVDGQDLALGADTVVLAAGSQSYNPLEKLVQSMELPYAVVGDAARVARAFEAVHQGYFAGCAV
jgi:2,4-dienoyl-CoA reductase (NADPH2)